MSSAEVSEIIPDADRLSGICCRSSHRARRFFEKWDHCHLHDLTPAEYEEVTADIENLKARYNYIEDIRDTFRGSRSSIPFYDIVKLSKMEPKKKGAA